MTDQPHLSRIALAIFAGLGLSSAVAAEPGFVDGTTATLQARNYFFSRDYADIVGPNRQSVLKNLAVRVRNVTARSNYRSDIDENRLIFNYTWQLL